MTESTRAATEVRRPAGRLRSVLGLVLLGAVLVAGLVLGRMGLLEAPVRGLVEWTNTAGPLGSLVLAGSYVAVVVALLPSFPLTMGAGLLYGPVRATLFVVPVATLGCTLAFLAGRYLFRQSVERRVRADPRFAALDRAIETRGFWLVFLLRLSPVVPYNILNYALGVTRVRLGAYVLGSMLGMIPTTFMWVQLGATAGQLTMQPDVPASAEARIVSGVAVIATLAITILVTRMAARALRAATQSETPATIDGMSSRSLTN